MKKITLLVCTFFIAASSFAATTNFMVNLASAKYKAGQEGKLYMVHFTANWCTPCKWMSDHTFTDDRVANFLSENYVSVKIDVEDFDGIIIKQKHNVQFLPTVLIFNSQGEEVGRFEEAIGPSKLMAILEENNKPNNKVIVNIPEPAAAENPSAISRPILPSIFDDSEEVVAESNTIDLEPAETEVTTSTIDTNINTPVYTPPTNENNQSADLESALGEEREEIDSPIEVVHYDTPTYEVEEPVVSTNISAEENSASESLAFLSGEGIFELDVKYKSREGYSVQIGLYSQYENVLSEVHKFKKMYQREIYVHIGKYNGTPVYRLLIGNFQDRQSANQMEYQLKREGLDCFVSDLARL